MYKNNKKPPMPGPMASSKPYRMPTLKEGPAPSGPIMAGNKPYRMPTLRSDIAPRKEAIKRMQGGR